MVRMNIRKMSRTEIKRLLEPGDIMRTFCLSVILLIMCAATYIKQRGISDQHFYYVFMEIFNGGYFAELLFIPIGYFVTTNVCVDVTEKAYRFYVVRADIHSYILCKYIIGILYTFLMTMAVLNVFVMLGIHTMPVLREEYSDAIVDVYKDLLLDQPIMYFELRILFVSLVTCIFVATGMAVSVFIHNLYVAALSPFLSYIIISRLQLILRTPTSIWFEGILSGGVRNAPSVGGAVGYILSYVLACLLLVGWVYYDVWKRSCYGERD